MKKRPVIAISVVLVMALLIPASYVFALAPAIHIEVTTNGQDADLPPGPVIPVGNPVTWTYTVTNTGEVTLTNVVVTDDQGVTVTCPKTTLMPGESMVGTGTGIAVSGQYANVGTVTAESEYGTVSDSDPSHYFGESPELVEWFQESAWVSDGGPASTRFVDAPGNWATWVSYSIGTAEPHAPEVYSLYAAQTHLAGSLLVYDLDGVLYAKFVVGQPDDGYLPGYEGAWAEIGEYHLQVVDEFSGFNTYRTLVRQKRQYGGPIPGRFDVKGCCDPRVTETGWIEVDIGGMSGDIFLAGHAAVWWGGTPQDLP